MRLGQQDLGGILAMMPAFATADAASIDATDTIDVENLRAAVNRIIEDGIDVLATTGSFGEFHTLLDDEFATLTRATVEAVADRVPLFIGCTALNSREVLRRAKVARDAGAAGILVGVPFYFPSTVDNAMRFLGEVAERFPDLAVMIYHNPTLHNVTLPSASFSAIRHHRNVIAMKDGNREPRDLLALTQGPGDAMRIFVTAWQWAAYAPLGAAGFWSYDCWMGPAPVIRLRDAIAAGDFQAAAGITLDLYPPLPQPPNLQWRETLAKVAIGHAGYCHPGPLRPPFLEIPPGVERAARGRAERWLAAVGRYSPSVVA